MSLSGVPVVMVHGAFCGGWTFDRFRRPFEAAGAQVLTPDLRGHRAGDAPEAVRNVSMADYAADIAHLCRNLPEPPVLIGHSMGGLVAQLAARRVGVRALVLLAPSAPWGVAGSSIEEAVTAWGLHMMGPFWTQAVPPDRGLMLRYSLERMPPGERRPVLSKMCNESGRALWETLNWWLDPFMTTSVGAGSLAAPSLVITGEQDLVHPPATGQAVASRLGGEFRLAKGMSHWLPGEPGWEEIASLAMSWLAQKQVSNQV